MQCAIWYVYIRYLETDYHYHYYAHTRLFCFWGIKTRKAQAFALQNSLDLRDDL